MQGNPDWAKEIFCTNGDGKWLERAINCQRCVVAHEARMRGYDVIARPSYGVTDKMNTTKSLLSVFETTNSILKLSKTELTGDIKQAVENIIKSFGEGARAFIWFNWDKTKCYNTGGHIIVAECRSKDLVVFGDPQSKERAAAYKLKIALTESITIMRVDNLKFIDNVKRCCENRGN